MVNSFQLLQNYPNPFNAETTIRYQINAADEVQLRIYDLKGQEVFSTIQQHVSPGNYFFTWNGSNLNGVTAASGIYSYQVTFNNVTQSRKLILLKKKNLLIN